jgi:hypothetical protein
MIDFFNRIDLKRGAPGTLVPLSAQSAMVITSSAAQHIRITITRSRYPIETSTIIWGPARGLFASVNTKGAWL